MKKGICRKYYYSYLILRKHQQKVAECLSKLTHIMLHTKALTDSGLEDLRTTISTWKTRNAKENQKDLKAILDEYPFQSRSIKCYPPMHLKTISSNWHSSKEGKLAATWFDRKSNRTKCEILLKRHKTKCFLHRIITDDEKWIH